LLKEKGRPWLAGGLDLFHPFLFHGAGTGATFAANDGPLDAYKINVANGAKERFK
jgi:hypothetical protein